MGPRNSIVPQIKVSGSSRDVASELQPKEEEEGKLAGVPSPRLQLWKPDAPLKAEEVPPAHPTQVAASARQRRLPSGTRGQMAPPACLMRQI